MNDPESGEDALRRARSVLSASPVAVAQCSSTLRYVWVSQRYADWLGVSPEEIIGHKLDEVLGRDCLLSMRPHIDAALAGREATGEALVTHKRLGPRWIKVECVPTFGAAAAADGWIEAITDITERRRTEACFRENQDTLQSFYDSSPFFMGLVELRDETLIMLNANRALTCALGTTPEELAQRPVDELSGPDEARLWADKYREARREGAPVRFEYVHRMPSGNRWLSATVAFVGQGPQGQPRFSFVAEETTAQKQVVEALKEANRSKDEFLAMLGHELRNPLSPIATAVHMLKLQGNEQSAKTVAVIDRQVQYLIRLVDDLLDVSRVTRGNLEMKKRLLRLQDVVAKGAELAMPLIEQRRHHLDVRLQAPDLRLNGDEARLAQVVSNLLNNSAKYTEPGGEISVEARRERTQIVLTVSDTGIGISADLLPEVFDLFTQGRQAADRARGGLGIGLTIVRSLVDLHGGTVEAESAGPGQGSLFTVRLPAATEEPAAVQFDRAGPHALAKVSTRVLAVDDNEDALDLMAELIRDAGHEVVTAKDGPSALRAMETFHPDVAVLDIGLPVMDGYELAGRIRAQLGAHAPRLIALTGYGQDSDRARAREAGFAEHLTKPVDVGRLLDTLDGARGPSVRVRRFDG
jgi:PAS domain S-box-containing protein